MADSSSLRRTKSSKGPWARTLARREEQLPSVPLPLISGKPTLVGFQVTSDDLLKANTNSLPRRPSHRDTWPTYLKDSRPGKYTFESVPTLTRTPWELERSKRPASHRSRASTIYSDAFEKLPNEVLHSVLDHLSNAHSTESIINAKALQNDLRALCLSNKKLYQIARAHLYREIWTPRHSLGGGNKKLGSFRRPQSRLQKLLRTLKSNADLATNVRCIRVSSTLSGMLESEINDSHQKLDRTSAVHILSDIVRHCHSLEHFLSFAPNATEHAAELYTSLAACAKLKSHTWRLAMPETGSMTLAIPGVFMRHHQNWSELHTLAVIHDQAIWDMPPGTISAILQKLPSLKHLVLSGLYPDDFHNGTLLMLPPLKSLRLEELHGITDQGLEQLARSRLAFSLEKLSLCGLELTSLRTIQVLFSGIEHLKSFTLHQDTAPQLSQTHLIASTNFSLSSPSLEYLHWDTKAIGHGVTILANSIASGRFPNLRKVKVPCDYDGAIQRLCRPISSRPITLEDTELLEALENHWGYCRSLSYSQVHAQIRIRECRKQPSVNVVVQDEDENVQHEHAIGSYLGNIASNIEYSLEPAVEGTYTALTDLELATCPRGYLDTIPGTWQYYYRYSDGPDGTRELTLDLDAFF